MYVVRGNRCRKDTYLIDKTSSSRQEFHTPDLTVVDVGDP